jgi:hypothetical protein
MCSYQAPGLYHLAKLSRLYAAPRIELQLDAYCDYRRCIFYRTFIKPFPDNYAHCVLGIRSALEHPWLCCFHGAAPQYVTPQPSGLRYSPPIRNSGVLGVDAITPHPRSIPPDGDWPDERRQRPSLE